MRKVIRIRILEARGNRLFMAGNIRDYIDGPEHIYVLDKSGSRTEIKPVRAKAADAPSKDGKRIYKGYYFDICLPLTAGEEYCFLCTRPGEEAMLSPEFGKFSRLSSLDGCYFRHKGMLIHCEGDVIRISRDSLFARSHLERSYKKALSDEAGPDIMSLRQTAAKLRKSGRPIWLVSDRSDCAEDNGLALFEYLMKSEEAADIRKSHDIRFVISADSPDFCKLQQIGPVIEAASDLHKAMFTASELVISSAADEWIRNPLGSDLKYFRDMTGSRFVFLQHGVIKDDLSGWLHMLKKNISIFITSAPAEWQSICEGDYGYDESVVKLTGLARYDKLRNEPAKKIAILPTWRKYAAPPVIPGSSDRPYSDSFRETDYFRFYNRLINDPRLLEAMEKNGYTGTFYMHPSHQRQWKDYDSNGTISVWKDSVPFSKVFSENSLLVTDYSSVAIDFAYLGKPVIYTQFDKETFETSHSYVPGYFDYERDGFGPVCHDYESSVSTIISAVTGGCTEEQVYLDRVNSFFAFRDRDNCRRIMSEIVKLTEDI